MWSLIFCQVIRLWGMKYVTRYKQIVRLSAFCSPQRLLNSLYIDLSRYIGKVYMCAKNGPSLNPVWYLIMCTLSLKRNAPWIHWLPLWPRVKVKWPRKGHILSHKFETGRRKPRSKISNACLDILKTPRVCYILEFVKLLKSHCNQCKFGIFSKWCISLGQEWMVLNRWVFFQFCSVPSNLLKRFHIKI